MYVVSLAVSVNQIAKEGVISIRFWFFVVVKYTFFSHSSINFFQPSVELHELCQFQEETTSMYIVLYLLYQFLAQLSNRFFER